MTTLFPGAPRAPLTPIASPVPRLFRASSHPSQISSNGKTATAPSYAVLIRLESPSQNFEKARSYLKTLDLGLKTPSNQEAHRTRNHPPKRLFHARFLRSGFRFPRLENLTLRISANNQVFNSPPPKISLSPTPALIPSSRPLPSVRTKTPSLLIQCNRRLFVAETSHVSA